MNDRLLRMKEVRTIVPLCQPHIYRLIRQGAFPRPIRLGVRSVAWRESEIKRWVEEREAASR